MSNELPCDEKLVHYLMFSYEFYKSYSDLMWY
jgi:hypothetical protein